MTITSLGEVNHLANVNNRIGDYNQAQSPYERALIKRQIGDSWSLAICRQKVQ